MGLLGVMGIGFLVMLVYMTGLWVFSLIKRDASIVDIFWGLGFIMLGGLYFALTPDGFLPRRILLMVLVTIWGLRLSIHILIRNWGREEDYRYQKWRQDAGKKFWWVSFFQVFLLQGVLMWLISTPLLAAQYSPNPQSLTLFDLLGAIIWGIGFFFEAIGDWQLTRFKKNPANKGKVLQSGVWKYTRHPNYFGDATQWWGYFLIALSIPGGYWTVFSPLIMTGLLLRVSGVALLEKTLVETKPQYRDYIARTSAFFPWPPKRPSEPTQPVGE